MMARAHVFVFVIRRHDGEYFEGCGYGGPGHAVPYWTDEIRRAKQYTTEPGARNAARKYGGYIGIAETDTEGRPERWVGFTVAGWPPLDVSPQDFDPHDYEGNNGPLTAWDPGEAE